ncbi:glycerate dehydrogenase [Deltaproteobacteria bacterium Smac51]|nr:glycerate dehydrogenase [Deltaproteobacteria bacterium Smac51]
MKITVIDEDNINSGDISWEPFARLGELTLFNSLSNPAAPPSLKGTEALITVGTELSGEFLKKVPGLRYLGILSTGYDFVDVATAGELGMTVTSVPSYGTASVAQYTFALILELCHQVGSHHAAVMDGRWTRSGRFSLWLQSNQELDGKTLGIVGFGRIGRNVARLGQAFGLKIVAHDSFIEPGGIVDGCPCLSLDEVLSKADILTLHCPLTKDNRGFINRETIAKMKPGARLINAARGGLINDNDLAVALAEGRLAAAAIDVTDPEPIGPDNPLLKAPNIIITPHIAWATVEARRRIVQMGADNLSAFIDGHPVNIINA